MSEYQFANKEGKIVLENYDGTSHLSTEQVIKSLEEAFQLFPYVVEIQQVENTTDVFRVTYPEGDGFGEIVICGKGVTPGGRQGLDDEQRIQTKTKSFNYVYDQQASGKKGIFLGVYCRDDQVIFCTWKVTRSNSGSQETPVSKQIKIQSIAKAMREGFAQQDKGRGEYACAFKPEFLYFYLRNSEWIHTGTVHELATHTPAADEADRARDDKTRKLEFCTGLKSHYPRNRILFGAPGTGKSFLMNQERMDLLGENSETNYERVTFHPDYSYANFVGTYKPVMVSGQPVLAVDKDAEVDSFSEKEEAGEIAYAYVPGPFMRVYVNALKSARTGNPQPFLLIIEEINRANMAAVFGDVFQLLDRGENEVSEYPIQASEDIKKYLAKELGGHPDDYAKICIPDNMFIWATMNSADQGVYLMDTAFKRRWEFTYLGIDEKEEGIAGKKVVLGQKTYRRVVEWNELRKAINSELLTYKVNEDKLMGPYFIPKKALPEDENIDPAVFANIFKNKVIMYLFDDAAKQKRSALFAGCDEEARSQYSKICSEFDVKGVSIFCEAISSQFLDAIAEDDGE